MKKYLRLLITLTLIFTSVSSPAEEITASKKALIDELIVLSGANKMGEMFSEVFVQQMSNALKAMKPDVNPKAFDIIESEINSVIHEEITVKKALNKMSYPLYDQYFTEDDLRAIIVFYQSDVGKKAITVMPQITMQGIELGKSWGQSIAPIVQQRVLSKLQQEGIVLE